MARLADWPELMDDALELATAATENKLVAGDNNSSSNSKKGRQQ